MRCSEPGVSVAVAIFASRAPGRWSFGDGMTIFEYNYPGAELEWDRVTLVRIVLGAGTGRYGVSFCTLIRPDRTAAETSEFARDCTRQIASLVLAHPERFGTDDRFQIVLAWPSSIRETRRQIIKIGGHYRDIEEIASQQRPVRLREGWDTGIFV
jgi:hypothetical protein